MKYMIDKSDAWLNYCLAVCECGWRMPATSEHAAMRRLSLHERHVHPADCNVRDALKHRKQRGTTRPPQRNQSKTSRP